MDIQWMHASTAELCEYMNRNHDLYIALFRTGRLEKTMMHELRHIRAFLKIAETRNFTRAASDLHISQSALTVQVQQLEASLGMQLFDRNKRGVTLTAAGQDVFAPLQRLYHDAQSIVDHAHEIGMASAGFVAIAALPTVCTTVLPEILQSFLQSHPGVRVQVNDMIAEQVRDAVRRRQVDLGIGTRLGRDADLKATSLFQDRLFVFVPPSHPLARRTSVTLREASGYALILPARASSVRAAMEAIAHRERIALEPQYEMNSMATVLAFVRAGLGIAILPESACEPGSGDFVRIPIHNRFTFRQIELLERRDLSPSPAAESFVRHLQQHFQRGKSARRENAGAGRKNHRKS